MVLFEIMTYTRPYEGISSFDVPDLIAAHKFPELPDKLKIRADYTEIIQLHRNCINPHPEKRPDCTAVKAIILDLKKY